MTTAYWVANVDETLLSLAVLLIVRMPQLVKTWRRRCNLPNGPSHPQTPPLPLTHCPQVEPASLHTRSTFPPRACLRGIPSAWNVFPTPVWTAALSFHPGLCSNVASLVEASLIITEQIVSPVTPLSTPTSFLVAQIAPNLMHLWLSLKPC